MTLRRPILVTGIHRSGSTWVGKMISTSPSVGYIPEPLNWETRSYLGSSLGICSAPVPYWYPYITKENGALYYEHLKDTLEFRYELVGALKGIRSLADIRRVRWEYRTFRRYRSRQVRLLVKNPFAVVSAEWFAETFDMRIIILIRHPAAFASSIKRLNWAFPFAHFLNQPLLIRDYLRPFEAQIKDYVERKRDLIDQAILLWRIVYYIVNEHRKKHTDWIFLRHEDVSRDPARHFRDLYAKLNLVFLPRVEAVVREYTDPCNPSDVPVEQSFSLKRDSRAGIWSWKSRLTEPEIERVREGTSDIVMEFYSDDDW